MHPSRPPASAALLSVTLAAFDIAAGFFPSMDGSDAEGSTLHARTLREFIHAQRLCVVGPQPGDRFRRSVAEVACCCDGAKVSSLCGAEYAAYDFTLDRMAEKW